MENLQKERDRISKNIQSMESKFWYRLIKVAYIFFIIAVLVGGSVSLLDFKPYKVVDNEKSFIQCNRDVEAQLIYYLDKNNWDLYGSVESDEATLSNYDDEAVRRTCARPIDPNTGKPSLEAIFNDSRVIPDKNYVFYPAYSTVGSYWGFIKGYLLFYFFLSLGAVILKEIFYYIVTGKRMFKPKYHYY